MARGKRAAAAVPKPTEIKKPKKTVKASQGATKLPTPVIANGHSRKRAAKGDGKENVSVVASKKLKLDFRQSREGVVLSVGQGDTGQLGLGCDIMERSKPALVKDLTGVVDVVAGGMHTVCLTKTGEVYSFGCNDEGALGRDIQDDDEGFLPGKVNIPGKVVQITAGDSHSAALTEDGKAFYWGTFRDSSGSFGLTTEGIKKLPVPLAHHLTLKKISSGTDHVALLTLEGHLYTVGCAEQGQLGRIGERFTHRGGRRGLKLLLVPDRVHAKNRSVVFADVWAGSYDTFALTTKNEILVCGLNNYSQLGVERGQTIYTLVKSESFTSKQWSQIALGQHHALALDRDGKVYSIGRSDYGRLGLGEEYTKDAKKPELVSGPLASKRCVDISCGTTVSFAVTEDGECYSWGMGTNGQLGTGDEEDAWVPTKVVGKNLETRKVLLSGGGGQHTVLLATE